jgi:hypothetical protein
MAKRQLTEKEKQRQEDVKLAVAFVRLTIDQAIHDFRHGRGVIPLFLFGGFICCSLLLWRASAVESLFWRHAMVEAAVGILLSISIYLWGHRKLHPGLIVAIAVVAVVFVACAAAAHDVADGLGLRDEFVEVVAINTGVSLLLFLLFEYYRHRLFEKMKKGVAELDEAEDWVTAGGGDPLASFAAAIYSYLDPPERSDAK